MNKKSFFSQFTSFILKELKAIHYTIIFAVFLGIFIATYFVRGYAKNHPELFDAFAAGNTYYVSAVDGNINNPGTFEAPFLTIQQGINAAQSGDIVYVRGGTYSEFVSHPRSGTITDRIVVQNYPNESPILDGTGVVDIIADPDGNAIAWTINRDYITVKGFEIRNFECKGISIGGSYNLIEGNIVHDLKRYGISVYRYLNNAIPTGNQIKNNEIYNVMLKNLNGVNYTGGWDATLSVGGNNVDEIGPVNTLIEGNRVHHSWGEGIMCWGGSSYCTIRGNTVYETWGVLIYLAGANNALVEKNFVYDQTVFVNTDAGRRHTPMGFNVNTESPGCAAHTNIIRNNIAVGTRAGVNYANYSLDNAGRETACTGFIDNIVEYNTFYMTYEGGVRIQEGKNSGAVFRNNIFYTIQGDLIYYNNPNPAYNVTYTPPVFENNLFFSPSRSNAQMFRWNQDTTGIGNADNNFTNYTISPELTNRQSLTFTNWQTDGTSLGLGTITGNVYGDPLFLNASLSSTNANDFKLQTNSPAKTIGASSTVDTDYANLTRPTAGGSSVGALEYDESVITPTLVPTSAPAVPWYNSSWLYRKKITIDRTAVSGGVDLTNFPVLINSVDVSLAAHAQSDADDILFTAADGTTKLSHEIEKFTAGTGSLQAWIKIPTLSATTDTVIYMYYGNSAVSNQQDVSNVWDSNYIFVHHLASLNESNQHDDSTINNLDFTTVNASTPSANIGIIGFADGFNGSNQVTPRPYNSMSHNTLLNPTSDLTIEAWVKPNELKSTNQYIMIKKNGLSPFESYGLYASQFNSVNQFQFLWRSNDSTLNYPLYRSQTNTSDAPVINQWYYLAGRKENTNVKLLINGLTTSTSSTTASSSAALFQTNSNLFMGAIDANSQYFNGTIDEMRLSNVARSDGWLATSYNNQNSPSTFYTISAESMEPTPTLIASNTPTSTPTDTPIPTNTPTNTPIPTGIPTSTPTNTPIPTYTPTPTNTPSATPTNIPTVTPTPALNVSITKWSLINTETQTSVLLYNNLRNKSIIDLKKIGTNKVNFKLELNDPSFSGSIKFEINGRTYYSDNSSPYSLGGDYNGIYSTMQLKTGTYIFKATPYSLPNGQGNAGYPSQIIISVLNRTWWTSVIDFLKILRLGF